MFTVCPKCALTLVVTAADLRVAQGYVRCGRCSSVFNALARLADDRQASAAAVEAAAPSDLPAASVAEDGEPAQAGEPLPEQEPEPLEEPSEIEAALEADAAADAGVEAAAAVEPEAAAEEDSIPEAALEFDPARTDASSLFVEPPPDPNWTAATGSFKAMVAANQEAAAQEQRACEVEVEIDAAYLASMLRSEAAAAPGAPPPPAGKAAVSARNAPAAAASAPASAPAPPVAPVQAPVAAAATPPAHARTRVHHHASPHARPPQQAAARPAPQAPAAAAPGSPPPPAAARPAVALRPPAPAAAAALAQPDAEADEDSAEVAADWRARLPGYAWPAGVALAVLVLALQILNHYRDDLAASTRFNRPLTALYAALGVHLVPRWDLRAYDVRQLGADVDPAGTITVRASIKNAAQQAQPLPLLRVTLQDRFGNRIASSDVAPRSYLPHSIPPSSFLSAGQRIDAQMGFVDPGANAVGFELDACLPAGSGAVACANDVATR